MHTSEDSDSAPPILERGFVSVLCTACDMTDCFRGYTAYMGNMLRHDEQKLQRAIIHQTPKQLTAHPAPVAAT